jgi:hypothetical protein
MMVGKLVDTIPTVTGKGLRAEFQKKTNAIAIGRSSNWGRLDQYAGLKSTPVISMVACLLGIYWPIPDTSL